MHISRCIAVAVVLVGVLAGCSPRIMYPLSIANQSGLSGTLSADAAVAIIRDKVNPIAGYSADVGSLKLDSKGFRFAKTETVKKQLKVNDQTVEVEYEETRAQQVRWQNVSTLEPYLSKTILGDLYAVRLEFVFSDTITGMQPGLATEITLYCKSYNHLTEVLAALQTLIGK